MVTCNGVSALMDHFLAYIDPGSGSLIIQAVIATIVAIPFFFRQQIGRVLRAVRRGEDASPAQVAPPTDRSS
jgi:ABC-type branched-subunit amino acid transport system permease subunit